MSFSTTSVRCWREAVAADVVEVRGHLGVVRGDEGERVRRQPLPQLGRDLAVLAQVVEHGGVVLRAAHGRDPREVAGRRTEQGRAAHVDGLDGLVERQQAARRPGARRGAR